MSSDEAIAVYTSEYLANAVKCDECWDPTQPEVYEQLMRKIAVAMCTQGRGMGTTAADVARVVRERAELRAHPLLKRTAYFAPEQTARGALLVDVAPTAGARALLPAPPSSSLFAEVAGAVNRFFRASDSFGSEYARELACEEATRMRALVQARLAESLATGSWRETSSVEDGDYLFITTLVYAATAERIVNDELLVEYAYEGTTGRRPYLHSHRHGNVGRAEPLASKTNVCATYWFRFPCEPPPATRPAT